MNDAPQPGQSQFHSNKLRGGEGEALQRLVENFDRIDLSTREKLENFTNWVRGRDLARFLFRSEIYRSILNVPGVVIEAGVLYGGSLSTWVHLGEIYEPVNYGRRVIGFDTFTGFPHVNEVDKPEQQKFPEYYQAGTFSAETVEQDIREVFSMLDQTRKLAQIPRVELVKGDICDTLPAMIERDKSMLVSLLHVDIDLYEPTKAAIATCLPRMPKGAVICFDELCYRDWPGETAAVLELFDLNTLHIQRSPYVPNIAYVTI